MFTVNQTTIIDIICDNQLYAQRLEGSGFIQFNTQCLIEHADMVIQSFKSVATHLNSSFTPTFNLTDVLESASNKIQLEKLDINDNLELKSLDNQLKELQQAAQLPISINSHDVHHYISTYTIVFIVIVCIVLFYFYDRRRRKPRLIAPIAAPRSEILNLDAVSSPREDV